MECIKHMYEYSFNLCVYQAIKFRKFFPENEPLVNIHNLIFASQNISVACRACSDHWLLSKFQPYLQDYKQYDLRFMLYMPDLEELKQRVETAPRLMSIFDPCNCNISDLIHNNTIYLCYDENHSLNEYPNIAKAKEFAELITRDNVNMEDCRLDTYLDVNQMRNRLDIYLENYGRIKGKQLEIV